MTSIVIFSLCWMLKLIIFLVLNSSKLNCSFWSKWRLVTFRLWPHCSRSLPLCLIWQTKTIRRQTSGLFVACFHHSFIVCFGANSQNYEAFDHFERKRVWPLNYLQHLWLKLSWDLRKQFYSFHIIWVWVPAGMSWFKMVENTMKRLIFETYG